MKARSSEVAQLPLRAKRITHREGVGAASRRRKSVHAGGRAIVTGMTGDRFSAEVFRSALLLHARGVPAERVTEVGAAVLRLAFTLQALEVSVVDLQRAEEAFSASWAREKELKEHRDDEARAAQMEETFEATQLIQMRIETFYFFAQRCLDETVALVDRFIAPAPITLGRHRTLKRNLTKLVDENHLTPIPEALSNAIDEVDQRVKGFRDDFIAHVGDTRKVFALSLGSGSATSSIQAGRMYDTLSHASCALPELLDAIERHVRALLGYVGAM